MIALLDPQIIIRDHYVVAPHNGADDRTWRQLDLIDRTPDHPGGALITVRHGLNRFGNTAAKGGDADNIGFTNMAEECGNCGLLR
ncbi:Uncharacterised protein [Klebsiella pneumoniae]|nr:Uncharacterised protein [Klebsiella pneumoniae]